MSGVFLYPFLRKESKKVKVKVIKTYFDRELNKEIPFDEKHEQTLDVKDERGKVLVRAGVAVEIKDNKPKTKKTV